MTQTARETDEGSSLRATSMPKKKTGKTKEPPRALVEKARAAQAAFFQDKQALEGREQSEETVVEECGTGAAQQTMQTVAASVADGVAVPETTQGSALVVTDEEQGEEDAGTEDAGIEDECVPTVQGAAREQATSEQVQEGHARVQDKGQHAATPDLEARHPETLALAPELVQQVVAVAVVLFCAGLCAQGSRHEICPVTWRLLS